MFLSTMGLGHSTIPNSQTFIVKNCQTTTCKPRIMSQSTSMITSVFLKKKQKQYNMKKTIKNNLREKIQPAGLPPKSSRLRT